MLPRVRRRRGGPIAVSALVCALLSFPAGGAPSGDAPTVAARSFRSSALAARVHYMIYLPAGHAVAP
jgi:hypothetical protein